MLDRNRVSKIVGIIGLGSVGHAVVHGMSKFYQCVSYDTYRNYEWGDILRSDIVFICVSTPKGDNGHLDCRNIDSVLIRLLDNQYSGLVVIKSTLRIGYMEDALKKFPELRLVYMPEFLREKQRKRIYIISGFCNYVGKWNRRVG